MLHFALPEADPDRYQQKESSSQSIRDRIAHALAGFVTLRRLLGGDVEVTRLDITVPDLPPELDGFRIVQVSDLHVGNGRWEPVDVDEAARLVHDLQPDVVINTGDFLQGEPSLHKVASVVSHFTCKRAAFPADPAHLAVLGNHDYWTGEVMVARLVAELQHMGVQVLGNRGCCLRRGSAGLSFVGLTEGEPGFDEAVRTLLSAARPRIALIHEPDLAERLPSGSADLVLAGHTHGGQITLPGLERFVTRRIAYSDYVHGLYEINDMPVYVNRGLGSSGLPIRFRARPEVALFRLVR